MKNKPLINHRLANFQIKHLLGRGGMAEVYYGMDVKLHRPVAIKVFDTRSPANSTQRNRFQQEARMMAQWRHNHIIQVYSIGEETGLLYYVMEYIDGYDLASIMAVYAERGELISFDDVLRIGDAVANALDYAHAKGVIHRDVKPANVMIANDDRILLGDFGLALDMSDKSRGEVFGSPHYISPEQARRSSDAVPQSDLYALGIILYEMLTGATPFNDPSPASLALQHITEAPPLPRLINPSLSEKVEAVLLKALEKDPQSRYRSGAELMAALRKVLNTKPAAFPAASSMPPLPVGAPAVQRSPVPLNSFTKQQDVVSALELKTSSSKRIGDEAELVIAESSSRKTALRIGVRALVVIGALFLGWRLGPNLFAPLVAATQTQVAAPSESDVHTEIPQVIIQPSLTNTASPEPTVTQTLTEIPATANPTNTDPSTQTESLTATLVPAPTATGTLLPGTVVKDQTGYRMLVYYDQFSFYILDTSPASRSVSGFAFERVNDDGSFQNHFNGWDWQKYFDVIQFNHCISLEIYPATSPYLNPEPCDKRVLSNLRLAPNAENVFWTPNDTSHEFRILWLNEEIARCEIAAGTCEFYVP